MDTAPTLRRSSPPRSVLRSRWSLPLFAFGSSLAFVLLAVVQPYSPAYADDPQAYAPAEPGTVQSLTVAGGFENGAARDGYSVKEAPKPVVVVAPKPAASSGGSTGSSGSTASTRSSAPAPVAGTPDPGSAKAIAYDMVLARGWGEDQYNCLVSLWNKESSWNVYASNRSSGAYGIPQALPGSKMASAGGDWQTNPATQITWGLGYITGRYGTPCGAWGHSQAVNWY